MYRTMMAIRMHLFPLGTDTDLAQYLHTQSQHETFNTLTWFKKKQKPGVKKQVGFITSFII